MKDEIFRILRRWYSDIAVLRDTHKLLVLMRDNAGENKPQELNEFFESHGVQNYFSPPYEQWHDGLAKSSLNYIMKLARSKIGGQF